MIAEPGRDWIAWFATARWNAGLNEASTARSISFGSFVRKVSLFAREASEGCHAEGEGGGSRCPVHLKQRSPYALAARSRSRGAPMRAMVRIVPRLTSNARGSIRARQPDNAAAQ